MTIHLPETEAPRVSVIIPAAAAPAMLLACLRSLAHHGPQEIPFEVIAVLTAAPAATAAALRESVTGVRVVASPVNLGLAGAGNRGRALARGDLLVLLHDDAEIEPGWLEALVATVDAHPEAGAVGGKVLFPDGRLQNAGMILWQDGTTSQPWIGETPAPSAFDTVRAVDYCGTSSLLVRAAAWDAAGGLDERFYPVYYVDVDLSMAIRRQGRVVLYQPRSRIRHHQGASGSLRFRWFVTHRNRRFFLEKWGSALAEHEPPEKGSAEAVQRAMARAEAVAERTRRAGAPPAGPPPERPAFDPDLQERRHLEMDLGLQKDYAAHLAALLDEAADGVRWREAALKGEGELALERARGEGLAQEVAGLRPRAAALAAIERTRWWRLYLRLLPILRLLRGRGSG
jgi:GT2 family glycosyltransferase